MSSLSLSCRLAGTVMSLGYEDGAATRGTSSAASSLAIKPLARSTRDLISAMYALTSVMLRPVN